jgi:uncharacterized membrane protein YphA (DoxX/SURF4 family)
MATTRISTSTAGTQRTTQRSGRKTSIALWTVQGLLAAVFLFAGSMKFVMPLEEMTKDIAWPAWFLYFIGTAEVLGGLGLVLPGLSRIRPGLTPLAAAGLVIIMVGATVSTLAIGGGAGALVPAVVGALAAFVAYGRTRLAPQQARSRSRWVVLQPAA